MHVIIFRTKTKEFVIDGYIIKLWNSVGRFKNSIEMELGGR